MFKGKIFSNKHYRSFISGVPKKSYFEIGYGIRIDVIPVVPIIPTTSTQYKFQNTKVLDVDSRGRLIFNLNDPYEINKNGKVNNINRGFD